MINVVKLKCSKATVQSLTTHQLKDRLHKRQTYTSTLKVEIIQSYSLACE